MGSEEVNGDDEEIRGRMTNFPCKHAAFFEMQHSGPELWRQGLSERSWQ